MTWFRGIAPTAAGSLVATSEGTKAFLPAPLPAGIEVPRTLQGLLMEARAELGKLWGIGRLLRNPTLFVRPLQAREAAASSRIEGTRTTNEEALANEALGLDERADGDGREVQNYLRALEHGVAGLQRGRKLSRGLILEVHRLLLDGVRGQKAAPGKFRETQVFLGRHKIATARFVPPPAAQVVPCMDDLLHYLGAATGDDPLVRVAMVHYQFETIHPFEDGNGRVGRLLIALQMLAEGLQHQPLLYLSPRLEAHRRAYYDHLLQVSRDGDFAPWIEFFVTEALASARETSAKIYRLLEVLDEFRARLRKLGKAGPLQLVDLIERWPFFTVADARAHLEVEAPATAKAAIDALVAARIAEEYPLRSRAARGRPARVYWCRKIAEVIAE